MKKSRSPHLKSVTINRKKRDRGSDGVAQEHGTRARRDGVEVGYPGVRKDFKRLHELPQTQRLAGGRLCEQNPPVQRGLREKAQDRQGPRVVPGPLRGRGCDHRVHWKCPRESTRRPSVSPLSGFYGLF